MHNQLNIAVIGCGYWGGNYVRVFTEMPETTVVAVCDQLPQNLEKIRKRFTGIRLTTSLDEVLSMDEVDAVVIATNATTHHAIARQCIEAGKHILLEKPMTTVASEAEDLMSLAEARGITLMIGHIYLYNSCIRAIKSYIDEARIGHPYYLYTRRTNLGPIRYDVNALWDLAPHDISIMNFLLGSTPEWVSAVGLKALRSGYEDVGFIALGYPNDIIGHIHVSWADPDKVREVVVVGSESRIVFNDLNPLEPVRIFEKGVVISEPLSYGEHHFSIRDGSIISPNISVSEPLKEQCYHFLSCVSDGATPLTDGLNGLEVVRVMEAVGHSIESKGMPVGVEQGGVHEVRRAV
jgi:predicted dehydrogenase